MWLGRWPSGGGLRVCAAGQVAKFKDPQEAAIALVVEAYRQWLANEVRTDDITTIVIYFDHDDAPASVKDS